MRKLILLLFFIPLIFGCDKKSCDQNISIWKANAKRDLEEFKFVWKEIEQNKILFQTDSSHFFINNSDANANKIPSLKTWFDKHYGWISYKNDTVEVHYGWCLSTEFDLGRLAWDRTDNEAVLLYTDGTYPTAPNKLYTYKNITDLGGGWFYVTQGCTNCGL